LKLPLSKAYILFPKTHYPLKPKTSLTHCPKDNPSNSLKTQENLGMLSVSRAKKTWGCFRCQELSHIASECPNKRVVALTKFFKPLLRIK